MSNCDPPDLQQLVLDHGTYDKITPEAWERFGREMKEWQAKVRFGELPRRSTARPAGEV